MSSATVALEAKVPLKEVNVITSVEPFAVALEAPLTELEFPNEHPVIILLEILDAEVKLSSVPFVVG